MAGRNDDVDALEHQPVMREDQDRPFFTAIPDIDGGFGHQALVCRHCHAVYYSGTAAIESGVCPARLHQLLKERIL
jgi:hypothetical protein